MTERSDEELVRQALAAVEALVLAQIGGVNAMANVEALGFFEGNEDDTQLHYAVIRVLTVIGSGLAEFLSEEFPALGSPADVVRRFILDVDVTTHPRDEDP
jgi:hypothetical protein